MRVSLKWKIAQKITDNLLEAHKRLSEKGSVHDLILLTRYILKLIQQPIYKNKELILIENETCSQDPPNECENDVT